MRIGLLGFGVVGRGVYDLTKDRTDMQVAKILCLEDISLPDAQAVKNIADIVNDDTIDITGFFLLKNNGAYEGYKYTYTSMTDPQLKGIRSVYFANDGTAYEVTATIVNGGDEITVTNINTIVDTFVNCK